MPMENLTPLSAKYFFYKIRLEEKLPKAYVIVHCILLFLCTLGILLLGTVEAFDQHQFHGVFYRGSYLAASGSGIWTGLFNLASAFLTSILILRRGFYIYVAIQISNTLSIFASMALVIIQIVNVSIYTNQCIHGSTTHHGFTCPSRLHFSFNLASLLLGCVNLALLSVIILVIERSLGAMRHRSVESLLKSLVGYGSLQADQFKPSLITNVDQNNRLADSVDTIRRQIITKKVKNISPCYLLFHTILIIICGLVSIALQVVEIAFTLGLYFVGAGIWIGILHLITAVVTMAFNYERGYLYYMSTIVLNGLQIFLSLVMPIIEILNLIAYFNICQYGYAPGVLEHYPHCPSASFMGIHIVLLTVGLIATGLYLALICMIECNMTVKRSRAVRAAGLAELPELQQQQQLQQQQIMPAYY